MCDIYYLVLVCDTTHFAHLRLMRSHYDQLNSEPFRGTPPRRYSQSLLFKYLYSIDLLTRLISATVYVPQPNILLNLYIDHPSIQTSL